jgi:hypothetical protein
MVSNSKPKVCFEITEEQSKEIKKLPRTYNLSEKLREALTIILIEAKEKVN